MPRAARTTLAARRSPCPIACALDAIGDRWSLLVIRDLFRGFTRYSEFLASPEGIPTNILADRLARLEEHGLATSECYQRNPKRYAYRLTPRGRDLQPVLHALGGWALQHVRGTRPDPALVALFRDAE